MNTEHEEANILRIATQAAEELGAELKFDRGDSSPGSLSWTVVPNAKIRRAENVRAVVGVAVMGFSAMALVAVSAAGFPNGSPWHHLTEMIFPLGMGILIADLLTRPHRVTHQTVSSFIDLRLLQAGYRVVRTGCHHRSVTRLGHEDRN